MILTLTGILFFLMVAVGGNRGLDSFFALIRTLLVLLANVYLIAWGLPAIPVTLGVSIFVVCTVLYLQNGRNAKMHAAVLAVTITVIFVVLLTAPVIWSAGASGYNEIELYEDISMYLASDLGISMPAITLSALVLGLLGAVMDSAVAITTSVNEIYVNKKDLSAKELFQSGMRVGKDILGTTVNTLFFAGLGESIMLAVLFMKNEDTISQILNAKVLFQELAGLLLGVIGCLIVIPVSSLLVVGFLTFSEDNMEKQKNVLKNCYNYFKKYLKNVKNMLK